MSGQQVAAPVQRIGDWLEFAEDGGVTVFTGKVEVGQNVRTALTQAVADELRVPVESIRLVMADTARVPFDAGTFGSRSTPAMAPQLRRVAAAAREALLDLAAERWEANRADLQVDGGKITHPETGQTLSFGELAAGSGGQPLAQPVPEDVAAHGPDDWTVAGTSVPKVEARALVTGAHRYASDVALPGMLHGKVVRPAGFNATLPSIDTKTAESLPGVTVVHEGNFVGVAAPDAATAMLAATTVRAEWDVPPQPSARELWEYFRTHPGEQPENQRFRGGEQHASGSIDDGLKQADHVLEQTYTAAYIAHAPLEPRAAVAQWADGGGAAGGGETKKLTVWTGTQRPFGVRQQLMEVFGLPEEAVRVIVPDTGAGYGGKHYGDAAIEAARLAKAAGKPVKLVWTREEEFSWAYARPAALIDVRAGVRADGTLAAWDYENFNAGAAGIRTPYDVANQRIVYHVTRTPLRQGSYRALAATANTFARESAMDELARLVGLEPLAFRLKNLKDERLRAVLEAAAQAFGWGQSEPAPGRGCGLACGVEKGGYVATCAEVAAEATPDGRMADIRIVRVAEAFECGAVVNPDHLRSQMEGAIVQGIGGALWEQLDFASGRLLNPRFSQYRVPRFGDVPKIETVLVDRKDLPSAGAGETPIIGIAPAVANAVFQATGIRLRGMPLLGPAGAAVTSPVLPPRRQADAGRGGQAG